MGHLKIVNFPFGTNGNFMIFRCPYTKAHYGIYCNETQKLGQVTQHSSTDMSDWLMHKGIPCTLFLHHFSKGDNFCNLLTSLGDKTFQMMIYS